MASIHCHSHFPVLLNLSSSSPQIKSQLPPNFSSCFSSVSNHFHSASNSTTLRRSGSGNGSNRVPDPTFFDENGAVDDMEGYLNHLSLEYDSVWDTKPSWCQPWTILLTGTGIVTASWLILNNVVITSIAATLICLWWYIFLYSYPKLYSDMIAERRKKVTTGQEDTYGMKSGQ